MSFRHNRQFHVKQTGYDIIKILILKNKANKQVAILKMCSPVNQTKPK